MILVRKLQSAVKLYRQGGWPVVAGMAWDQSVAYMAANPVLPRGARSQMQVLNRLFNDRPEYSVVTFDLDDLRQCRPGLLFSYLRRQFFDAAAAVPDHDAMRDAEIPILADALYRRWDFTALDSALPRWRERLAGTKFAPMLAQLARRTALRLGRLEEAGAGLDAAGGDIADCLLRAEIRDAQGRLDEAATAFAQAVHRQPSDATVRLAHAFHLLKRGRLLEGLENWGLADHILKSYPLRKRAAQWMGEDLGTRTLMVIFEHGFGDMIQMARFLHPLRAAQPRARIVGLAPRPLVGLLAASFPAVDFVAAEGLDPPFDLYIPSFQMPLVIEAASLEPRRDYIRLAPPALPAPAAGRKRVGICWRGHPRQYELTRSVPLERFARLFARPDTDFVVLLNKLTPAEETCLEGFPAVSRPAIADFTALGGLVAACDHVVSVDTAVAHVAAAAGRPLLLLSRPDACWRWGPTGRRSPWYDGADVVRHPGDLDWEQVLAEAAERLDEALAPAATSIAVAG